MQCSTIGVRSRKVCFSGIRRQPGWSNCDQEASVSVPVRSISGQSSAGQCRHGNLLLRPLLGPQIQ